MAKASILVIEDDPDIRELLSFSLAKEGWAAIMASDGEEGLAALPTANPDCVVLDIMLPGIDGLEVLRVLKSDPARKRLPVIMTTAKGEEADIVTGLELGAEDYVVKPYSPKVLVARIRAALRRSADLQRQSFRAESSLARGSLRLDSARHEVRANEAQGRSVGHRVRHPGIPPEKPRMGLLAEPDHRRGQGEGLSRDRSRGRRADPLAEAQARRLRRRDRDGAGRGLPHPGLTAVASSLSGAVSPCLPPPSSSRPPSSPS